MIKYEVRVYEDGNRFWYLNDKRHREDGPAVECSNGTREWFLNGVRHREDGPAVEHTDGDREWYLNGKRHRTDGPAIEYPSGKRYWYLNGERVTEEAVTKPAKELTVAEIEQLLGHKVKIIK
jgi:hypothetical protein